MRIVCAVTSLAALLLVVPLASAGYDAGTTVEKGDYDYTPTPADKSSKVSLCYIDDDGSGTVNSEPIYLALGTANCAGAIQGKDIRFVGRGDQPGGREVKSTDDDFATPYTGAVEHALRYYDIKGEGKMKPGNRLYLDLKNLATFRVDVGDLRVTAEGDLPGFSYVTAHDADLNRPLSDVFGTAPNVSTANAIYKAGSAYYVNVDGDSAAAVEDGDVRLSDKAKSIPQADVAAPMLDVVALQGPETSIVAGMPFQVSLTVQSMGDQPGSGLVRTMLDGTLVDTRGTPTLRPGESVDLVLTLVATIGEADLTVDVLGQTVVVTRSSGSTNGPALAPNNVASSSNHGADFEVFPKRTATAGEAPSLPAAALVLALTALLVCARRTD